MQTSSGRAAEITLFPNGTGAMKGGPTGFTLKWRAKGGMFCMKPGPMAESCMTMKAVDGGFDGYKNGKRHVSLRR